MRSPLCAAALVAAAALTLASCGGGGGGGGDSPPTAISPSAAMQLGGVDDYFKSPSDPPVAPPRGIKSALREIFDRSDTLFVEYGGYPLWTAQREVHEAKAGRGLDDAMAFLLDGHTWGAPPGYDFLRDLGEFELLASEGGISAAAAAWVEPDRRGRWAYGHLNLGVWMEHSFFMAMETIVADAVHDEISVHLDIYSVGTASGTNPALAGESATWSGIMIGFDEGLAGRDISRLEHTESNVYVGAAQLTLENFENSVVDVLFSSIGNGTRQLSDVLWNDLPLTAGGFEGRGILGRFYGPAHEEVGGVFQFDQINGAFGAIRQ